MANEAPFIGKLNTRIEVYKVEVVRTTTGEPKETDVLVARPWAYRNDTSGTLAVEGKITALVNRSYVIRRNSVIAKDGLTMHIVQNGVKFAIEAIKEIGRSHLQLIVQGNE